MPVPCIHRPVSETVSAAALPRTKGRSAHALTCSASVSPAGLPRDNLRVVVLMVIAFLLPFLKPVEVVRACQEGTVRASKLRSHKRVLVSQEVGQPGDGVVAAEELVSECPFTLS